MRFNAKGIVASYLSNYVNKNQCFKWVAHVCRVRVNRWQNVKPSEGAMCLNLPKTDSACLRKRYS